MFALIVERIMTKKDFMFKRTEFEESINLLIRAYGIDRSVTYVMPEETAARLDAISAELCEQIIPLLRMDIVEELMKNGL